MGSDKKAARVAAADAVAGITRAGAHLLGRSASATPGQIARQIDGSFIADKASLISDGRTVVVCGTNGKTTVTNMLATVARHIPGVDEVVCNSEGANMMTGVATALVGASRPDWGIFEVDELATRLVLPELRPDVFILLNLFRDQMDRSGEIDHTQDVLAGSLSALAGVTTLVANADDPLVADVGMRYAEAGGSVVWFGISKGIHARRSRVNEARLCPRCGRQLGYSSQTYAMMGRYACPAGDFRRPEADYESEVTRSSDHSCSVKLSKRFEGSDEGMVMRTVGACSAPLGGTYMAYNLTAVATAAHVAGLAAPFDVSEALRSFAPKNGRLQEMSIGGRRVVLNLAKNPSGFNQNLDLVCGSHGDKAVCVSINDNVQDGHDISWIWDIDFENLRRPDVTQVFAAGTRAGDVAIRMRYAGIDAEIVDGMGELLAKVDEMAEGNSDPGDLDLYVLCNYTALWPAKAELERMERRAGDGTTGETPAKKAVEMASKALGAAKAAAERATKKVVTTVTERVSETTDGSES